MHTKKKLHLRPTTDAHAHIDFGPCFDGALFWRDLLSESWNNAQCHKPSPFSSQIKAYNTYTFTMPAATFFKRTLLFFPVLTTVTPFATQASALQQQGLQPPSNALNWHPTFFSAFSRWCVLTAIHEGRVFRALRGREMPDDFDAFRYVTQPGSLAEGFIGGLLGTDSVWNFGSANKRDTNCDCLCPVCLCCRNFTTK